MVGRRNALRWWRSSTIDWVSRVFMSCSDLGQDAVGVEVGWVDREQLEVGVAVEAEQPDRPLGAVQHDQADRVRAGRADRQRLFDRHGQLTQRRVLEQPEHFDELAGPDPANIALETTSQDRETCRE